MTDEQDKAEREHCEHAAQEILQDPLHEAPGCLVYYLMRERQAVRAELYMELTQAAHAQIELQCQLGTAREQRDTYYAGMKEAKAQLHTLRTAAERAVQSIEADFSEYNYAIGALRAALDLTKPETEPVNVEQLIKNLEHERTEKHAAQVALTQLRTAAERRDTFDPAKVRELCDYAESQRFENSIKLKGLVQAVRASEVKP